MRWGSGANPNPAQGGRCVRGLESQGGASKWGRRRRARGRWGSQIKRADARGSYHRAPGVSNYLRLVAWSGLGEGGAGAVRSRGREPTDGQDGRGCGFFSEVPAGAGRWFILEGSPFSFLMGKKERRGVLFLLLNGVNLAVNTGAIGFINLIVR